MQRIMRRMCMDACTTFQLHLKPTKKLAQNRTTQAICFDVVSHAERLDFHATSKCRGRSSPPQPRTPSHAQQNVRNEKSLNALQKIMEGVFPNLILVLESCINNL
jgi:hypothetical protein